MGSSWLNTISLEIESSTRVLSDKREEEFWGEKDFSSQTLPEGFQLKIEELTKNWLIKIDHWNFQDIIYF